MTPRHRKQARTVGAISLAGIAALATTVRAAEKMLFLRHEGQALERRMDTVEQNYRSDVREIRDRLEDIWRALPPRPKK